MFDKMKQLMEIQKKAKEMQKTLDSIRLEKTSPDGKIRLTMNGNNRVESLSIDDSLLSPAQKQALEKKLADLITETAEEIRKQVASQAMGLMKGMGLGGL